MATVEQLARLVNGTVAGDGEVEISSARALKEAGPGEICFLDSAKAIGELQACRAAAAVVPMAVETAGIPLIRVEDPLLAFAAIFSHVHDLPPPEPPGIDPRAVVHATARIGADACIAPLAQIGAGTVIGDRCRIGAGVVIGRNCALADDVIIHPNAVLYDRTRVGHRVIIHAGAVIGADGFGYRMRGGRHIKVPQLGIVELGDDVEVGAGGAIDRSTFGVTRIGEGTKIDNLVQIAHNCQIGKHNILVSQVGIAGSSSTGDYVVMAGQAGAVDHVHIGKGAVIGAQAGVTKNVDPGDRMIGTPALRFRDFTLNMWTVSKLTEWRAELKRIKQHLGLDEKA